MRGWSSLCEDEAEGRQLLRFDSVGDEAPVPQGGIESCVARLGVAAVGVGQLTGAGGFRDLLQVLGAVEARSSSAFAGWPPASAAGCADGDSVRWPPHRQGLERGSGRVFAPASL